MTFHNDKAPAANELPKATNYDTTPPAALLEFMLQRWRPRAKKAVPKVRHLTEHQARRRALSRLFPEETLVIPSGHEKVRSNDTVYRFRPGSDFFYLTGNTEPDCVLILQPRAEGGHDELLFVEPNPGRTDKTFYTDRMKGELWVGPRLGVEESAQRYGVGACRPLSELPSALDGLTAKPWRLLRGFSPLAERALPDQLERDQALAQALAEMRLLKDAAELRELGTAIAATHRGFADVIRALPRAKSERTVEGVFNLRAREDGNDVGYGTIAASGAHACILHWVQNDGALNKSDLLLLDAGVEAKTLYTADITRTLPLRGRFSPAQREIYELVYAAQQAAFKAVRPGNDFMEPNRVAMRVLAEGLERLKILPTTAEVALRDENQFYKRYSLHNVSHMLGLDVHDCAQARQEAYKFGKLKVGMVLTVEPGLYFQVDDLTVPSRYRGIGIRIEDDVVVTAKGYRNLSQAIPSSAKDVEAWIKRLWR